MTTNDEPLAFLRQAALEALVAVYAGMTTGLSWSPTVRRNNIWKDRTAILRWGSGTRLGLSHARTADDEDGLEKGWLENHFVSVLLPALQVPR